uniref:Uncharacterized protein n=1 Tax=Arundo donax TaxID=35708 RepID=A0A0A9B220_ARUDO
MRALDSLSSMSFDLRHSCIRTPSATSESIVAFAASSCCLVSVAKAFASTAALSLSPTLTFRPSIVARRISISCFKPSISDSAYSHCFARAASDSAVASSCCFSL